MKSLQHLIEDISQFLGGWRWLLLALMVATAMGEGFGIALILPLLSTIGIDAAGQDNTAQVIISTVLEFVGMSGAATSILVLAIAVFLVQALLSLTQQWWVARWQRDYAAHWQIQLYRAFMGARWGFFMKHKQGELVNSITTETTRLASAFFILAQLIATIVISVIYLLIAMVISWQASLLLLLLGIVLVTSVKSITNRSRRIGIMLGPHNADLNVKVAEFLGGARLIKATATEHFTIRQVEDAVTTLRELYTMATFLPGVVRAIFEFTSLTALCLLIVFGHSHLGVASANLLVVLALFVRLFPRINMLQQHYQLLSTLAPALNLTSSLVAAAKRNAEPITASTVPLQLGAADITIKIDTAGYENDTILRSIDISLPERGFIGIVGESGSGKSTLINCLLGLAQVHTGCVSVGDIPMVTAPLADWRHHFGYVPQETIMFHLPIQESIAWGVPATMAEIEEAARRANAHDFIAALPNGYAHIVGDQGARLSGGQRQRIGLARALLRKPLVLLLDEATSALDSTSEQAILQTIEALRQDICVVSVAHRLTSVRAADRIYVMSHGTIVEEGTWDTLMTSNGPFHTMALAQHVG